MPLALLQLDFFLKMQCISTSQAMNLMMYVDLCIWQPLVSLEQKVKTAELGEAVILDADNNKVTTPFRDLESLPLDVVSHFDVP